MPLAPAWGDGSLACWGCLSLAEGFRQIDLSLLAGKPRSLKSIAYMATMRPSQRTSTILFQGLGVETSLTTSPAGILTATRFPFRSPIASVVCSSLNLLVCMAQLQCKRSFVEIASRPETFQRGGPGAA